MNRERRQYDRILARYGDVIHTEYECLDYSEIGMRFSATSEVEKGHMFSVKVQALAEPITLLCRVVWCREIYSASEVCFQFGVTFEGFSMAKQLVLRELVNSRSVGL